MGNEQPVALITGSASGFGLHICIKLAALGYDVIATMRDAERRAALLQAAEENGVLSAVQVIEMDVTQPLQVAEVVQQIQAGKKRIDVLVNNAGYACGGMVEDVPLVEWQRQLETNFLGVVTVTKAVLPIMRAQGHGKVINMSSVSGRIGLPGYAPYSASKFALEGFSEALRFELLPLGIHVVLIEPGAYKTAIWDKGFANIHTSPDSPYQSMMNAILRLSKQTATQAPPPEEVADAVVKVVTCRSPRLRYVMGRGSSTLLWGKLLLPWKWLERLTLRVLSK